MSNIHFLKSWPEIFRPLKVGLKQFEVRVNDRDFNVGDRLVLQEWDPAKEQYTGVELMVKVSYILQGKFGLPPDVCVMQLELQGFWGGEWLAMEWRRKTNMFLSSREARLLGRLVIRSNLSIPL